MTEWSEEDRTIALVWQDAQKARCSRCGTWEWQHEDEDWVADHYTCHGCRKLDEHQRNVGDSPGSHDGRRFGLFREG